MKPPIKIWRYGLKRKGKESSAHLSDSEPSGAFRGVEKTTPDKVHCREYILTTAIKDLPEDKLAELGVMGIKTKTMFCAHGGFGESCIVCYPK